MKILFKYPSRQRPDRFFDGLQNIIDHIADKDNYHISCTLDTDDTTMNNEAVVNKINNFYNTSIAWGVSKSKIDAVNRSVPDNWDIICVMSDDMRFRTHGFDNLIRQYMPTDLDGFVHLMDDYAKERVCTVSILGRKYYERDGYIYHPDYYSMWCDDEESEKAKLRGKYILVPDIHLEHLHYTNGSKAKKDELYWRNDTYNKDKVVFEQRKARGFDL
jgi:hypothetical protein